MADTALRESFAGGLVTARRRVNLQDGELTRAEECYYKPNDGALYKLPAVAESTGAQIPISIGVGYIDGGQGGSDYMWILTGAGAFQVATVSSDTVTFASAPLTSGTPGTTTLDVVQHGVAAYLLSGGDIIRSAGDPTVATSNVPAGLTPPDDTDFSLSLTAGIWDVDSALGQYWYWITWYNSAHDMESGFVNSGNISTALPITPTASQIVRIDRLTNVPAGATHWRVYRSGSPAGSSTDDSADQFPLGFLISGDIPAVTVNILDAGANNFTTPYPLATVVSDPLPNINPSRNGTPPIGATTGDIFENSLVVNESTDVSKIRYSWPDNPTSWSDAYFIKFDGKVRDRITKIRALNDILIVGMKETLWRCNYLPRAFDAQFDRGRVSKLISWNHGITGHKAADIFTTENGSSLLAFHDRRGLFATDGMRVFALAPDIDFNGLVGDPANVVLRNFPRLGVLAMFYSPDTAANDRALFVHYHSSHRKPNGGFKVTGPHTITNGVFDAAYVHAEANTVPTLYMLRDASGAGGIHIDRYTDSDSATDITIRTRTRYVADTNTNVPFLRSYLYHGASAGTGTIALLTENLGAAQTTLSTESFTPDAETYDEIEGGRSVKGFAAEIVSPASLDHILFEVGSSDRD